MIIINTEDGMRDESYQIFSDSFSECANIEFWALFPGQ